MAESSPVRSFGDYELLSEIARGAMGIVWRARQKSLGRLVALKVILAGEDATEEEVARFRAEAEAAATLQHPGIVAIHEIGVVNGRHYLSMDLVEGTNLAEACGGRPLPVRRAAELARQVAVAIEYAHGRGVLHRDVKPSNVLLDAAGRARVTDFGLAKRATSSERLTATGAVLGTPGYLPPEQADPSRGSVGPASDVYSIGAVLYETLTGRPPFLAESPVEALLRSLSEEPVAPRVLNAAVPRDLETICLACLRKEPSRRYASAAALADDLGRFLAGEPVRARPTGRVERVVKWARRQPLTAGLVAATALAAAGLVTSLVLSSHESSRSSRALRDIGRRALLQVARAERLSGNRDEALKALRAAARLRAGPDVEQEGFRVLAVPGLRLLREVPVGLPGPAPREPVGAPDSSSPAEIDATGRFASWDVHALPRGGSAWVSAPRLVSLETGAIVRGPSPADAPEGSGTWGAFPRFAPVGSRAAVYDPVSRAVRVWDAGSDFDLRIGDARPSACWSPDGSTLAVGGDAGVSLWDVAAGRETKRLAAATDPLFFAGPDRIVAERRSADGVAFGILDVGSGTWTTPWPGAHRLIDPRRDASADGRVVLVQDFTGSAPHEVRDTESGTVIAVLEGSAGAMGWLLSRDGSLAGFRDPADPDAYRLYDVARRRSLPSLRGLGAEVTESAAAYVGSLHPEGRFAALVVRDSVRVFHVASGKEIARLAGHRAPSWSPDGRLLVTRRFGEGGTVLAAVHALEDTVPSVRAGREVLWLQTSADGKTVAANETLWTLRTEGGAGRLVPARQIPFGNLVLLGPGDRRTAVALPGRTTTLTAPKPVLVRAAETEGAPSEWHLPGRATEPPGELAEPVVAVFGVPHPRAVAFARDTGTLALFLEVSGRHEDGGVSRWSGAALETWHVARGACTGMLWHPAEASAVAFAPDGKALVWGDALDVRGVEEVLDGSPRWTAALRGDDRWVVTTRGVTAVRFAADGRHVYAGCADGLLAVVRVPPRTATDEPEPFAEAPVAARAQVEGGAILSLAAYPDGRRLATGGANGVVRLWDVGGVSGATPGTVLAEPFSWQAASEGSVTAIEVAADGETLLVGDSEGWVRLWRPEALRTLLRAELGAR